MSRLLPDEIAATLPPLYATENERRSARHA